jgi:uncharacterized protein YjbI with pentapeptide repeats
MDVRDELLRLLTRGAVDPFNEISRRSRQIVDLSEADLTRSRIPGADLSGARLDGTRLAAADLSGANLTGASLRYANLKGTNLEGANLSKANLYNAYLAEANLAGALLKSADIAAAVFPDDLSAAEIDLAARLGTRLRRDPTVALLQQLTATRRRG